MKLVQNDKIKETRINRSVKRIVNLKEKYNVSDDMPEDVLDINEFNNEVSEIRQKCGL